MLGAAGLSDFIQNSEGLHAGIFGNLLVWLAWLHGLSDVVSTSSAEDDNIKKGVGSESAVGVGYRQLGPLNRLSDSRNSLGTVYGHAGSFSGSV